MFTRASATRIKTRVSGLPMVLRIGSAHNKAGSPDIKIVQISHLLNFFSFETLVYIHLQA